MRRLQWMWIGGLLLAGCANGRVVPDEEPQPPVNDEQPPPLDPTAALFPLDRLLEISITLEPSAWDALRHEPQVLGMASPTCGTPDVPPRYTVFSADITIDGQTVRNVGLRKKGSLGSLSTTRPSLKVKLDEYVDNQAIATLKTLTLNNSVQDPAYIRQCLGYGLFRDAGVPAPRCAFAQLTVNGKNLGVYVHVETIKKPMLRRHFTDPGGNLYEGGGSDFSAEGVQSFQPKTNEEAPDCSDLEPLVGIVGAADGELRTELEAAFDLDSFLSFWALEVLTAHWDGYAKNTNNYYLYHDPTSDRFVFVPWGIDEIFTKSSSPRHHQSIFACALLPWRMFQVAETRALYVERLRELLASVWNEEQLLADIDRLQALVLPVADPEGTAGVRAAIDEVRAFIRDRRATVLAELDAGPAAWPDPHGAPPCMAVTGHLSGEFTTDWGTIDDQDPFAAGAAILTGEVSGTSLDQLSGGATAGLDSEARATILLLAPLPNGEFAVAQLWVPDVELVAPGALPLDLLTVFGMFVLYDPATETSREYGLLLGGSLVFAEAAPRADAPITGTLDAEIISVW